MDVSNRRALAAVAAAAMTASALALALSAPPGAGAVPVPHDGPGTTVGPTTTLPSPTTSTTRAPAPCVTKTWTTPPRIEVHWATFFAGGGGGDDFGPMLGALVSINDMFNQVGDTSAAVGQMIVVDDPFEFGEWQTDAEPTIHIGFVDDLDANGYEVSDDATGATLREVSTDCHLYEAHIAFPTEDSLLANRGEGRDYGTPDVFYNATTWRQGEPDETWFRTTYLHELLHAFDLDHAPSTYSFLNYPAYDGYPWANRTPDEMIRPLPADVRTLRDLYPGPGSRSEVALLNTYFDAGQLENGAATHQQLCRPSLGAAWSAQLSESSCGVDGADQGATEVCAGDDLRTRVLFANYSNRPVDVHLSAWFSTDPVFDGFASQDLASPTTVVPLNLGSATSSLQGRVWDVPALVSGTEYHVILRVVGGTTTGDPVEDWIPLSDTVTGC
jgi:hypothetical protein